MNKLNLIVRNQLPEFIREDYPAFVSFVETYYKWLEQQSLDKVENLADIDKTVDSFLKYFKNEIDSSGIFNNIDNKLYLRHLKEFYASKGAPESFNFLFKVLFQKESTYIQPWDFVFKPSAGQWKQDNSVLVNFSVDPNPLIGTIVNLVATDGKKYRTYVNNILYKSGTVYEVFIDRFYGPSDFLTIESIFTDESIVGNIVYTTTTLTIERRGSGFEVGQIFDIESAGGRGTVIKIKEVDADGGIRAAEILSFGLGYETTFNILLSPKDAIVTGQTASISFSGQSEGSPISLLYETPDKTNAQNESGLILNHNYANIDTQQLYMNPDYVGKVLGSIKSGKVKASLGPNNAQIKFNYGCICRYPGYYISSQNIIGDEVYIQDSYYYQAFSYVTSLEETLDKYSELLKGALHPIGTMHFANYQINNNFDLAVAIEPSLNLIAKGDAIRDLVQTISNIAKHLFRTLPTDQTTLSDSYSRTVQYNRTFEEQTYNTDVTTFSYHKYLQDLVYASDEASLFPYRGVFETALITESTQKSLDKYISDGVLSGTAGGNIFKQPTYVDHLPSAYWYGDYLENEYAISN